MRKSFTRLFSLFILLCVISLQVVAVAPVVSSITAPTGGATNVKPNAAGVTFTITFNQNVFAGTAGAGVIALSNAADVQLDPIQIAGVTNTNITTGSTAVIDGNKIIVTFKTALTEEATYYITATSDAVMNAAGEYWVGLRSIPPAAPGGTHDYVFTVGDYTPPTVLTTAAGKLPADNATAVAINQIYRLTFSEDIQPGTGLIQTGDVASKPGNIGLYKENGDMVELFDATTATATTTPAEGAVGIVGTSLYINPTDAKLAELGKYYIRILNTAIVDLNTAPLVDNKNVYAGINNNTTWNFQLADLTPPTFVATPANNATNIQQGQVMKLTFSDNRTAAGLTFNLKKVTAGAAPVATTVGALAIGDDVKTMVLFTEDPAGGAAFVGVNPANFTATYTAANEITIAFTGANKFKTGATYQLGVLANALADDEKNVVVAAPSVFTAGDFTAPFATAVYAEPGGLNPGGHAANFSANSTVADKETTKVYFGVQTSDVDPTSGLAKLPTTINYIVTTSATVPAVATVKAGTELPRITGQNFKHQAYITTDNTGATLASNTLYRIYYVITDNATVNNTSVVLTALVTTNDILPPVPTAKVNTLTANNVTVTSGAAATADVKMDSPVTITFDENVIAATANITVKYQNPVTLVWATLADGPDYTFAFNGTNTITITGAHADIATYVAALWKSKGNYQVIIDNNEIVDDMTGKTGTANPLSVKTYSFTVEDFEGPSVTFNPANASVNFNNNGDIVITFSETPYYLGAPVTNANIDNIIELRKGDGVTATTASVLEPRTVSISGNVVTIVPTNKPLDSEIYYRAAVSTDVTDVNGYKLNMYKGNTVATGGLEYSVFKTKDNRTPLVSYTTYDPAVDPLPLAANAARTSQGLVSVINTSMPVILLDESVREIASNTNIVNLDPNQIRTLITLKKTDASGPDVEFNVVHAQMNTSLIPPAAGKFEIVLDPIDYPGAFTFDNAATYYVSIGGIEDAADNAITSNATFTIRDTTPLTISSLVPANAATAVAKNGNIVITFNQTVRKLTTSGTNFITVDNVLALGAPYDFQIDVTNVAVTISGNQVTIPYTSLASDATFGLQIDAGSFIALGNGATNAISTTTFSTVDETGPSTDFGLAANLSDDESTGNSVKISGDRLTVLFDENIVLGYGVIKLRKPEAAGATLIADINVQSSAVTVNSTNKKLVQIDLPGVLAYSSAYFLEIPQTAFKDAAGNNFTWADTDHAKPVATAADITAPASLTPPSTYAFGDATWDFQTELDAAPAYTTFVPAAASNDVGLTAGLTINFSEPVTLATAGIRELTIYRALGNTVYGGGAINLATASLIWNSATSVSLSHPDFEADTDYYICISAGAFVDATGNAVPALGTLGVGSPWNFTTKDQTAPTFTVATSSGAALTKVGLTDNLIVTFSEPIVLLAANWWAAFNTSTGTLAGGFTSATLAADNRTLTINPATNFASLAPANLVLNAGAVRDMATAGFNNNALQTVVLTGEDKTAPVWAGGYPAVVTPAYSKSKVKFNVALDEKSTVYYMTTLVGALTTNPTVATVKTNASYSYNATPFVPNAVKAIEITGLAEYQGYDVYVMAEDLFGNQTTVTKLTLYTRDEIAPTLFSLYPANGAVDVNYNHVTPLFNGIGLKIRFSEKVQLSATAARLVVRRYDNNLSVFEADRTGGLAGTLAITSSSGTAQDIVSVTVPLAVLADKTQYYVEFEYDMVYDAKNGVLPGGFATANNVYADAFIGKADWSFTTADETAPVLAAVAPATTLVPADNATGVAVAPATMTMRFSEPITKGTGIIYIYRVGNATPQEIINVTSSDVVVNPANNKELLITRHNTFASEVDYYVQFPATGVSDLAPVPNYYAGIANTTDWNFKTADITAPEVVWSPVNNSTNVLTTSAVTVMFKDPRQTELTGANVFEPLYNNASLLASGDIKSYFSVTANGAAGTFVSANYVQGTGTVTLNITGGLKANTTYVISFNPPANYKDDAGNLVPASTVTFSTQDDASPVITFSPVQLAADVPLNSAVTITFNKTIYNFNDGIAGVNHINFTPTAAELKMVQYVSFTNITTGLPVAYDVTVVVPGKEYQLIPTGGLLSSNVYEVVWNANVAVGAAQEVYDRLYLNANKLNIAPAYPATGSGTGGDKVRFTAEDKAAPFVTLQNPLNVAPPAPLTIVNPTSNIVLTFNERVVAGAGNIQIRRGNGQIFHELAATACTYSTTAPWTVTIPHPAFEIFTSYYVIIPEGAITDNSSNKNVFAGYSDNTKWAFKTDDGTAPYVMTYSPVNGATDIPVFSNLSIKFSENITPIAGKNIVIYYKNFVDPSTGDGNAIEVIDITSAKVVVSGSDIPNGLTTDILTIDPATTFDKLGTFYIRIDNGAVQDFAATPNNYAGISNNTTWAFTITDNTKPALVSVSPVNGSTGIGSLPTLTMTFDRNVLASTGSVRIFEYFYNPLTFAFEEKLHEAIPASSSQITGTGSSVVSITPSIALGDNKVYYVLVDNTAFTNTASSLDPFVGISNPFAWRFTTGDNTVPTVAANPVSGTTGLGNTFDVTLTFSEPVVGAIAGITTTGATSAVVTEETAGTVYKVAVTAADLATVTVTASATITDAAGNALAATMFTYGVADNNGPTLTVDPVSGSNIATNAFNVTLTFNEDVTGVAAAVTVDKGTVAVTGSGKVYTAAIDAPSSSAVVMTVANTVKDLADNAFAGATFTYNVAGDVTAPAHTALSPTGTLASSKPTALEITFNEDVMKGTGKIYIYRGANAEWSFDVTSSAVAVNANKVTVTLASSLDQNATYFVYVDNGFVTDVYANKYAGISNPATWTFTTGGFPTGNDPVLGSLEFKVYPNPFVNELKVDNASKLSRIIITSMTGQKVKEIVNPTSTIQTNELRSGVYFISLYVDDVVAKTERIVKR